MSRASRHPPSHVRAPPPSKEELYALLPLLLPAGEVVVVHHFPQRLIHVADAVVVQPLFEIVGLRGNEPDYFFILQADDKGIDTENVGGQFCRIMSETGEFLCHGW